MSVSTSDDANDVVKRMQALRSTGDRDVLRLQYEMGRVSDWREHVRARPLLSAVAAAALGFIAVRAALGKKSQAPVQTAVQSPVQAAVSEKRKPTLSALGFVGGIVGSMARQVISQYVKSELKALKDGYKLQPTERTERRRETSQF